MLRLGFGVAQVVEHLLSNLKAQSTNPSNTKTKSNQVLGLQAHAITPSHNIFEDMSFPHY
jgi:hypothetical protein